MKSGPSIIKYFMIAAIAFALSGANAFAVFTWVVRGKVIDADTKKPIKGVSIILKDEDMGRTYKTKTNDKGIYLLRIPWGKYHLKVKAKGYIPQEELGIRAPQESDELVKDFVMKQGEGYLASELTKEQIEQLKKQHEEAEKVKKMTGKMKKLFKEAMDLKQAGQWDTAIEKLTAALEIDQKQPNILGHLADCYYQKGEYDKAIEFYKKGLALSPTDANMHTNLGNVYVKKGMIEEAKKEFETAINADPAHADINYFNMGVVLLNAGKYDSALDAFKKSVEANASYAPSYYQLGMCYINQAKYKEGIEALEKYLKLAPNGQYAQMAKQMLPELKKLVGK